MTNVMDKIPSDVLALFSDNIDFPYEDRVRSIISEDIQVIYFLEFQVVPLDLYYHDAYIEFSPEAIRQLSLFINKLAPNLETAYNLADRLGLYLLLNPNIIPHNNNRPPYSY